MNRPMHSLGLAMAMGLAISLPCSLPAVAQEAVPGASDAPPELITDRPDFTESSVVVPLRSLQLESGFTYEKGADNVRTLSGPEALLRYGLARRTELRLGLPDYVLARGRGGRASGFGDTFLGFKQQLGPSRGYDFSIIAGVSLPTGASAVTSDRVDPEAVLTWSRDLNEQWSLAGQFGLLWPTEDSGRNFTGQVTVVLGRALGERWGTFLEYAGEFPDHSPDVHLLHHGYTYALTPTSQLDFHLGFGVSKDAPDFFIGAGYSVRF